MQAPPVSSARSSIADSVCLDGYVLQEVIAESRAAIVYRAIDESLKLPVAIKEYLPHRFARRDAAARVVPLAPAQAAPFERGLRAFVDEARTLARCDHPSLVRVMRLIEANGTAYSVMPHYAGAPLTEVRRGMSAPPDEAALRALLDDLLGALEEFHRIGGVHGGVTPDNILLLRDDRPLLLGPGATSHEIGADRIEALMAYLQPPAAPRGAAGAGPAGLDADFSALAEVARFCITGLSPIGAAGSADGADGEPPGAPLRHSAHGSALPHYSESLLAALDAAAAPLPRRHVQSAEQFRNWLAHGPPGFVAPGDTALRDRPAHSALSTESRATAAPAWSKPVAAARNEPAAPADAAAHRAWSTESGAIAAQDWSKPAAPFRSEPAAPADAGPFFATLGGSGAAEPRAWNPPPSFPPLLRDPTLDPTFGAGRLEAEPGWATDGDAGTYAEIDRGGDARAAAAIALGPRRRRRVGLWVGVVAALLLLVAVGGVWVFDQMPVRIDGWARGLAAFVPGAADHAAAPAAPAAMTRSDVAVQSSATPPDRRVRAPGAAPDAGAALPANAEQETRAGSADNVASDGDVGAALPQANVANETRTGAVAAADADAVERAAPPATTAKEMPAGAADTAAPSTAAVAAPPTVAPAATSRAAAPAPKLPVPSRRERASQASAARTVVRAATARQSVVPEQSSPRDACGDRTQFSLYRCMQTQCAQPRWEHHEQCDRLRMTDRVD